MTLQGNEIYLGPNNTLPVPRYLYRIEIICRLKPGLNQPSHPPPIVYVTFNSPFVPKNEILAEVNETFRNIILPEPRPNSTFSNVPDVPDPFENNAQPGTNFVPKGLTFRISLPDFRNATDTLFHHYDLRVYDLSPI